MTALIDVLLAEDFADSQGRWSRYDCYDAAQRAAIRGQTHVDLFSPNAPWSLGTLASQPDRNHWPGLSLVCNTGTTSTVCDVPISDISALSYLSLALPAFPQASVTNATSTVTLADSHGHTASVPFSSSLTTLVAGDCELRLALSAFTGVDLTSIEAITLQIVTTATVTFRLLSARAIGANWEYSPVDVNTIDQRLVSSPPPSGAPAQGYAFPGTALNDARLPSDFPILLRATDPAGAGDPRPIDLTVMSLFNTGSMASALTSTLKFVLREDTHPIVTQQTLDTLTQSQLDALGHQPNQGLVGATYLQPRVQTDLEAFTQTDLDGRSQADLEGTPELLLASWLTATLEWTATGATLDMRNTTIASSDYNFPGITLSPNTLYLMRVDLSETTMRARIYVITTPGLIPSTALFDSGVVSDDFTFLRRRGRFGWYAHLADGDSFVEHIRTTNVSFAEYRSASFESISPVTGAQLYAGFTPNRELFISPAGVGGAVVVPDTTKSNSGQAWSVTTNGTATFTGMVTNPMVIEDFTHTVLRFDLFFPSSSAAFPLQVQFLGEFNQSQVLNIPTVLYDSWDSYEIDLSVLADLLMPGTYTLRILQPSAQQNTWYFDKFSIQQRVVSWYARGRAEDPYGYDPVPWIPFRDQINDSQAGVLFDRPGNQLQLRALAHRQSAFLSSMKCVPKYAPLGRLVWDDQEPVFAAPPTAPAITSTTGPGTTVTLSVPSPPATDSNQVPVLYIWDLGDGAEAFGPQVVHTYASTATVTVSLTIIGNNGGRTVATTTVTP